MPSANRITSRSHPLWLSLVILLLAALLSACGSDAAPEPTSSASPSNNSASVEEPLTEETTSPETKTISTINGDIEIPSAPQRIVAEEYLGTLIALDVIPVAAPGLSIQNYYYKDALSGIQSSGDYGKPSPELIMTLNPDLIITGNNDTYEILNKIAPTLVVPYGQLKNAREELTFFGEALGKETEAAAWLADYAAVTGEQKSRVDSVIPADATFSILEYSDKSIWVYGDNFGRGGQPIYQVLGRKPPAAIANHIMEAQWEEISAEMLDEYAGDYLIVTANNRTVADFENDPLWAALPAVKNKRLYVWPEERSWYYDPLAVKEQTKELADWLVSLPRE
ncbi:ABC transporter substrate-binding protein [Paenibacillus sp. 598K]|uniref:ABC transporter substrate-binding protein n=1 Tax=Paenibacillus sp. 598K TaxID=1117987 RepID=UPI000FFAEF7D|nr:ABC transporter substrate-binding protein [Paenibacillus sp. 598K]GBF73371.1 ABC transporter substrate-binding protein [Paenibacillus sp. 598K]